MSVSTHNVMPQGHLPGRALVFIQVKSCHRGARRVGLLPSTQQRQETLHVRRLVAVLMRVHVHFSAAGLVRVHVLVQAPSSVMRTCLEHVLVVNVHVHVYVRRVGSCRDLFVFVFVCVERTPPAFS